MLCPISFHERPTHLKNSLIRRAVLATVTAAAVIAGGVLAAAPAEAATIHNRMALKIGGAAYTLDEYNTTTKTVSYNIDCHTEKLWAGYHYTLYKNSAPAKKYVSVNVDPLRAGYINEHYWSKFRVYKSFTTFNKTFTILRKQNLDKVKTSIGFYCLRDTRLAETKVGLTQYVGNIQRFVSRNGDTDIDLSKVDFAADEISTPHKFSKSFAVTGNPTAGFTATGTDKTDGYRWTYTSSNQKYAKTKV